jgi:hypothetical protein
MFSGRAFMFPEGMSFSVSAVSLFSLSCYYLVDGAEGQGKKLLRGVATANFRKPTCFELIILSV